MKLTNKILLAALVLLLISFTAFRIMFNSRVELVPNPFKNGFADTTFAIEKISSYEIKGNYSVHFIKSEYDSIKIKGPDNLVERYTKIERKGETLSIISQIDLSKYYNYGNIEIRIYTKGIKAIYTSVGSILTLENFIENNFEVTAEDSSIVDAKGCSFVNVKAVTKDKAIVSIENTKDAIVNILNSSSVFLTVDNGEITGTAGKDAELILLGDVKRNTVIIGGNEIAKGEAKHE